MSKVLSLKLKDDIYREAEKIVKQRREPRNAYFNDAIDLYNKLWNRKLLRRKLTHESQLVSDESLLVLEEFELMEEELPE